jgi:hypothetical protein
VPDFGLGHFALAVAALVGVLVYRFRPPSMARTLPVGRYAARTSLAKHCGKDTECASRRKKSGA